MWLLFVLQVKALMPKVNTGGYTIAICSVFGQTIEYIQALVKVQLHDRHLPPA